MEINSTLPIVMKENGIKNFSELSLLTGIDCKRLECFPYDNKGDYKKIDFKTLNKLCMEFGCSENKLMYVSEDKIDHNHRIERGESGIVYFLKFGNGLTKIGFTRNISKRMETLKAKHKTDLNLLAYVASYDCRTLEKVFHDIFKEKWVKGEMFDLSESDMKIVNKFKNGEQGIPRSWHKVSKEVR